MPGCSASSPSGPRAGCWCRTRSASRRCAGPGRGERKLFRYPGLKEDYYLADFEPDHRRAGRARRRSATGCSRSSARRPRLPPITRATRSTTRCSTGSPPSRGRRRRRDPADRSARRAAVRARADASLIVPERAIDAQSLIAYADLVVSAGGTMNREAVALGTPVYTIFSGRMGAVDERLIADGLAAPARRPRGARARQAQLAAGPRHPRDPELCWSRRILEAAR